MQHRHCLKWKSCPVLPPKRQMTFNVFTNRDWFLGPPNNHMAQEKERPGQMEALGVKAGTVGEQYVVSLKMGRPFCVCSFWEIFALPMSSFRTCFPVTIRKYNTFWSSAVCCRGLLCWSKILFESTHSRCREAEGPNYAIVFLFPQSPQNNSHHSGVSSDRRFVFTTLSFKVGKLLILLIPVH